MFEREVRINQVEREEDPIPRRSHREGLPAFPSDAQTRFQFLH